MEQDLLPQQGTELAGPRGTFVHRGEDGHGVGTASLVERQRRRGDALAFFQDFRMPGPTKLREMPEKIGSAQRRRARIHGNRVQAMQQAAHFLLG